MTRFRLRQLVIACEEQDSYNKLQKLLGLGVPFHDPGVAEFGLHNAVFAIGDQFLEIVVPVSDNAPARRFIDRLGEGGYMAIFQTDDIAAARQKIADIHIRSVWNIDLDDISATHLHPADIGGAIVSIDQANPPESWRWGGKSWEERSVSGCLTGAELSSSDPEQLAARWADALGLEVSATDDGYVLSWESGTLRFIEGKTEKMQKFDLAVPDSELVCSRAAALELPLNDNVIDFAGVSLRLSSLDS